MVDGEREFGRWVGGGGGGGVFGRWRERACVEREGGERE